MTSIIGLLETIILIIHYLVLRKYFLGRKNLAATFALELMIIEIDPVYTCVSWLSGR